MIYSLSCSEKDITIFNKNGEMPTTVLAATTGIVLLYELPFANG